MVLPDLRLVGVVERQAHAAAIIAARMAEGSMDPAPVWDSLETFDGRAYSGLVDIVVAGIPCQGNSVAGRRRGTSDVRWLWSECWRVVRETGARWLFLENVPGLLTAPGDPLGEILDTLAASGWDAEWDHVPAGSVGAPHIRDRFFLLAADTNSVGVRIIAERDQRDRRREGEAERGAPEPRLGGTGRNPEHPAGRVFRRGAADASPEVPADSDEHGVQARGRGGAQWDPGWPTPGVGSGQALADAQGVGRDQGRAVAANQAGLGGAHASGRGRPFVPGSAADPGSARSPRVRAGGTTSDGDQETAAVDHPDSNSGRRPLQRSSRKPDSGERTSQRGDADGHGSARSGDPFGWILDRGRADWDWGGAPEPVLRAVDDGIPAGVAGDGARDWIEGKPVSHADELHALGNAVVPHAAAFAFSVLWTRLMD